LFHHQEIQIAVIVEVSPRISADITRYRQIGEFVGEYWVIATRKAVPPD
jgi:hypothetical protein